MRCQVCGARAETMQVNLMRNIGLLVVRLTEKVEGQLCKACIRRYHWKYFAINVTLGWWGLISLLLTPVLIISNLYQFLKSRRLSDGLPLSPDDADGTPSLPPPSAPAA